MERAGFGPRLAAMIIDIVAVLIAVSVIGLILGGGVGLLAGPVGGFSFAALIIMIIPIAYGTLDIINAATPGKQAMKLKIKNEDGSDASQEVLAKRWAIKNISWLLRFVGVVTTMGLFHTLGGLAGLVIFLGCFFALTEEKQALHDKLVKTAVFKVG